MTRFAWSADTPCPLVYIGKHHRAVDAVVRAFFAFFTACRTSEREALIKRERPPLELVAVFAGKLAGTVEVFGIADDAVLERRQPACPR